MTPECESLFGNYGSIKRYTAERSWHIFPRDEGPIRKAALPALGIGDA
jgi:hypothetical protein